MPSLSSTADVWADTDKLLAAADANAALLQDVESVKAPLVQSLARLKELTTRRDTLKVDSQVLSKDIQRTLQLIRDQSTELRSMIKAKLGVRSGKLAEFKVAPRREGVRRKRGNPTPEPAPTPETKPATTPPATG